MISFSVRSKFFLPLTVIVLFAALIFTGCTQNEIQIEETAQAADLTKDYNEGEKLSSYTVTRTTAPISIDGKLDEADWQRAVEAPLKNTLNREEVPLKSTVKFLWDDTYLYVAFYCEDPDAWATLTEEDDPLWGEEVVELFIDPDCNGFNYYEYEINPINQKVDLIVNNGGKRLKGRYQVWKEWDFKKLKSAVYVKGDGKKAGTKDEYWSVEVAVPFDDLWELPQVPPKDGDMWRLNAYRIERGKLEGRSDDFYAAFSPTIVGSFHTPWQFGKIYFKK